MGVRVLDVHFKISSTFVSVIYLKRCEDQLQDGSLCVYICAAVCCVVENVGACWQHCYLGCWWFLSSALYSTRLCFHWWKVSTTKTWTEREAILKGLFHWDMLWWTTQAIISVQHMIQPHTHTHPHIHSHTLTHTLINTVTQWWLHKVAF